ncbi:unnamed protein product [Leptidea sinapis]|uniref:DNA mismatch repair proteins mutS family domain-containing protein n=1 Tax=Leptidea sinapis TaxID=189913 RepID=A0A5E4Q2F3_9NEOP|nr:unnamed protein product [Leptidea sinapis]
MNVIKRETQNTKSIYRSKNNLVHRDATQGIRGAISKLPVSFNAHQSTKSSNKVPRYSFSSSNEPNTSRKFTMGPPSGLPPALKRKVISSTSTKPESSSSRLQARILASDSAAGDSSLCTPRRPAALKYISSSSREGRGMARGEIGMAAVDLRHPHLVLCQFSDTLLYTHTMTKINFFNPVENFGLQCLSLQIIFPHTFCEGAQPNQLYQLIKDQYPLMQLTAVQRRHFNDAAGRQQIQSLCAKQYSSVLLQVVHKFYALTSAAAVLKYVEYIQCIVFVRESLKIEYHSSENTMIIAGPTCCLLGVLGPTYTIAGIRALRAAILQPSCKKEFIEARLDVVNELIDNETRVMIDLQILFLCIESQNQSKDKGEAQLNQVLLLKTTMELVPKLVEALQPAESGRLRKMKIIAEIIRNVILDDVHYEKGIMGSLQRCFAVKPQINGLLDVARRTYSELIEDIQKNVEQLGESFELPLRLNQNVLKGFHIVLPIPKNRRNFNVEDLPPIFIQFATPEHNFTLITGPNMGGKSIYIKQIAIMQVMAQLGCFLPATSAVLRLTDRIFSRIGFNDSVELNASTFVVEMKEVQHILQGLTPSSLVIIDELCSRHTTVTEENSGDVHKRLIYQHKIELGITNIEHYGLALAAKTNLPVETVHLARELADFITKNRKVGNRPQHQEAKNVSDDYILYQLNAKIKQEMRRNHNYEEAINIIINRFAQENPALIRKLRKENSSTSTDFNENNTNTPENATEVKTSEILSETNQSNNNSKSAKVCVINAESGMEIMNNIESENSFTREDFTENPEGMGGDNKSNVKTSTDMLCTIDNEAENLFSRATNQNNSDQSKLSYETNHAQTGHNKAFESDNIVIDDNINGFMGSAPDRNETDNKNANTSCDSSSSLAEALTQIIYSSNSDSDKSVDFISTDEELVDETIRELNIFTTELTELQNIILTPPIGFRDT